MKFKKTLTAILAAGMIALAGCKEYRTECSEPRSVEARATHKQHVKEQNNVGTGMGLGLLYGVAMDDIPTGVGVGTALGVATSEDEKNYITFTTSRDSYTVNNKTLFERFNSNDIVIVSYRDVYFSTYDGTNLVSRDYRGCKFLNAQPNILKKVERGYLKNG